MYKIPHAVPPLKNENIAKQLYLKEAVQSRNIQSDRKRQPNSSVQMVWKITLMFQALPYGTLSNREHFGGKFWQETGADYFVTKKFYIVVLVLTT